MKIKLISILTILLPGFLFAQETVTLANETDSISYALAVSIATKMKAQGLKDLNTDAFSKAFNDVLKNLTRRLMRMLPTTRLIIIKLFWLKK